MKQESDNKPLSMRFLQERIGFPGEDRRGRQLLRALRSREKALGVRILIEDQNGWPRATVAAVRKHAPDLIKNEPTQGGTVGKMLREFRRHLEDIDDKIAEQVSQQIAARCEPQFEQIKRELHRAEQERGELAIGLRDLAGRVNAAFTSQRTGS